MRLRALADPLALVIAGAGVATAVISGLWWIGALGLAGWAIIAVPGLREPPPEPDPVASPPSLEGLYARAAERLESLAARIASAVEGASPVVRGTMEDLPPQVRALVGRCRGLLAKQAQLDHFLAEVSGDDPRREAERLAAAAAAASDPSVRERYAQALEAARARGDEMERIRTNRERLAADLAEVEARLKQVLSQAVAMDSLDQTRITGLSCELRTALGDLSQQVAVVDRVLRPEAPPPARQPA